MTEQEKKPGAVPHPKQWKQGFNRYQKGNISSAKSYKSKTVGLEDDTFDVGAASDPAKFRKSLKSIETYIQKTYCSPDDIVKAINKMRPTSLVLPTKPDKTKYKDSSGNIDEDEFAMARFEWQENYKSMMKRKEKK